MEKPLIHIQVDFLIKIHRFRNSFDFQNSIRSHGSHRKPLGKDVKEVTTPYKELTGTGRRTSTFGTRINTYGTYFVISRLHFLRPRPESENYTSGPTKTLKPENFPHRSRHATSGDHGSPPTPPT